MKIKKALKILLFSFIIILAAFEAFFYFTTKLSAPPNFVSSKEIKTATSEDYKNSIVLSKNEATIIMDGKSNALAFDRLSTEIKPYLNDLKKREIKIITSKDTPYKQVLNVLDIMTIEHVAEFRLLTQ